MISEGEQLLRDADAAGANGAIFGPVASYSIRVRYVQDRIAGIPPEQLADVNAKAQEWAGIGGAVYNAYNTPDRGGFSKAVKAVPIIGKPLSDVSAKISNVLGKVPVVAPLVNRLENNTLAKKVAKIGVAVIGPTAIASEAIKIATGGSNLPQFLSTARTGNLVRSAPVYDYAATGFFAKKTGDSYLEKANNIAGVGKAVVAGAALAFGASGVAAAPSAVSGGIAAPSAGVAIPSLATVASGTGVIGGLFKTVKNLIDKPGEDSQNPVTNYDTSTDERANGTNPLVWVGLAVAASAGIYLIAKKA